MDYEQMLQNMLLAQNEHIARLAQLMERSEERIDRTNEMVRGLGEATKRSIDVIEKITKEYSTHLGDLSECRNALLAQNKELLTIHERDMADKESLRKEIRETRDKMFDVICRLSSNHGVKVENNMEGK